MTKISEMSEEQIAKVKDSWVVKPILQSRSYMIDDVVMFLLTRRGMDAIKQVPILLEGQIERLKSFESVQKGLEGILSDYKIEASMTDDVIKRNFNISRLHNCISLWVSTETCVEEAIVSHLKNIRHAQDLLVDKFHDMPRAKRKIYENENGCRRYYKAIENYLSSEKEYNVIEKYKAILDVFDLRPDLNDEQEKYILFLSGLRNLVLHRGGVVDRQFKEKLKIIGKDANVGEKYILETDLHKSIYGACIAFHESVLEKAMKSVWAKSDF